MPSAVRRAATAAHVSVAVAVDDDLAAVDDALLVEQRGDLGLVDACAARRAGNATAPGMWPPRASPSRRQPL